MPGKDAGKMPEAQTIAGSITQAAEGLPEISEIIVVEGRDDQAALSRAVSCCSIATHGFGIRRETLALIEKAYSEKGIIIFTDPDFSGDRIRERLTKLFPDAVQARLSRGDAEKSGDIGIENASPSAIRKALFLALERAEKTAKQPERQDCENAGKCGPGGRNTPVTKQTLFEFHLTGYEDSMQRRESAGSLLGIGGGNANAFLKKLNGFGIGREELEQACQSFREQKK